MLVGQLVNTNIPTVSPADDVVEAAHRLLDCPSGVLPVVSEDRRGARVVGLLRYWDALAATYGRDEEPLHLPVANAMSPAACTCLASDSVGLAVRLMRRSHMDALPVVDRDGYLVGMLSFADLVRVAAR